MSERTVATDKRRVTARETPQTASVESRGTPDRTPRVSRLDEERPGAAGRVVHGVIPPGVRADPDHLGHDAGDLRRGVELPLALARLGREVQPLRRPGRELPSVRRATVRSWFAARHVRVRRPIADRRSAPGPPQPSWWMSGRTTTRSEPLPEMLERGCRQAAAPRQPMIPQCWSA